MFATIQAIKKLGVKVIINKDACKIFGVGMNGYRYKKNLVINAQNSGTLGRLISGILIDAPIPIKIIGDRVYQKEILKELQNL